MNPSACRASIVDGKVQCFYMLEPPEALEPLSLGTMLFQAGLCEYSTSADTMSLISVFYFIPFE